MSRIILVTGASGFVGRELALRLAEDGSKVRAAARDTGVLPKAAAIEPVALPDLEGVVDWSPLLAGVTHVVHAAGIAHASTAIPEATYEAVNATATRGLARAASRAGVKRIVLLSSVRAQTGPTAGARVRETDLPHPTDAYGRSKLAGERAVAGELQDAATDFAILRPVLVYGAGVKGNMRLLFKLARSRLPLPLGGLGNRRSVVSLGNLASAVAHVLAEPRASRGTFLVADDDALTPGEIMSALRAGLGAEPRLVSPPAWLMKPVFQLAGKRQSWERLAGELVADTSALRTIGWRPPETAKDALGRAIANERPKSL